MSQNWMFENCATLRHGVRKRERERERESVGEQRSGCHLLSMISREVLLFRMELLVTEYCEVYTWDAPI